uniref:Non-specific protein-tyrosine kinase n=1 Tax=Gongylonema pulchrum TaxID=637853 RepID=A0A183E8Z7_9BILA
LLININISRDVAARNCLIGVSGSLKLSDFGLSKPLEELKRTNIDDENIAWPIPWMAPETLSKRPKFTTKSDVYAFGVLIYEVYSCGGKPWPNVAAAEEIIPIVRKGKMMATPPLLNEKSVEDAMRDCWKRKPVDRPDFVELVKRFRIILRAQKVFSGKSETSIQNNTRYAKQEFNLFST